MTLNVIMATFNRRHLLQVALKSLLNAEVPPGLDVSITIVDNGSTDDSQAVVEEIARQAPLPVRYLLETRRGHAHTLNTGVASTDTDLIALVDDDETVDRAWFRCIQEAFQDPHLDFLGGPYIPNWGAPRPDWLPRQAAGVIGWIEASSTPKLYNDLSGTTLPTGNAAMRRDLLKRVGPYRTDVGSHHDTDMFKRFLDSGARGLYHPRMIIYHYIPAQRLQKSYFRRWMWRAGRAYAELEWSSPRRRVAGIPLGSVRALLQAVAGTLWQTLLFRPPASRFAETLDVVYNCSYIAGCIRMLTTSAKRAG